MGWSVLVRIPTDEAYEAVVTIEQVMLIVLAIGALVILGGGYVVGAAASGPLKGMSEAMNRLAEGDKSVDVPATGRVDEIGEMANSVLVFKENLIKNDEMQATAEREQADRNARAERVASLATDFDQSSTEMLTSVGEAATSMQGKATDLSDVATQTSEQAQAVAAASEEAANNVLTVASAAEELSASIQEIARQVSRSTELASNAESEAE